MGMLVSGVNTQRLYQDTRVLTPSSYAREHGFSITLFPQLSHLPVHLVPCWRWLVLIIFNAKPMAHITEHHLFFMAADFDHTQHKTSGAEYTNGYILYFTATGFDIHCKASISPLNNNCIPWQHHTRPLVWLGNTLLLLDTPFCVSSKRWLKCNGTVYKPSKTRTNKAELTEQSPAL